MTVSRSWNIVNSIRVRRHQYIRLTCMFTKSGRNHRNFYINKKYDLSNSVSVQCNFFIFDHVTFSQFKKSAAVYKIS